ncbi:MAG TPA: hypothetical protein VIV60_37485 [Polyangiaceae bacterium]
MTTSKAHRIWPGISQPREETTERPALKPWQIDIEVPPASIDGDGTPFE